MTISGRTAWDATVASRRGQPRARAGPNRASRPGGPVALLGDTRSDCLGGGSPSQRRGVRERAARQACPEATVSTLGQPPTRPRRFAQRVSAALLHHTGSRRAESRPEPPAASDLGHSSRSSRATASRSILPEAVFGIAAAWDTRTFPVSCSSRATTAPWTSYGARRRPRRVNREPVMLGIKSGRQPQLDNAQTFDANAARCSFSALVITDQSRRSAIVQSSSAVGNPRSRDPPPRRCLAPAARSLCHTRDRVPHTHRIRRTSGLPVARTGWMTTERPVRRQMGSRDLPRLVLVPWLARTHCRFGRFRPPAAATQEGPLP